MVVGSVCGYEDLGFAMFGLRLLRLGSLFGRRVGLAAFTGIINTTSSQHHLSNSLYTFTRTYPSGSSTTMQQLNMAALA
tara:strand:- start:403 stop:639 length:237 start_codon:yes stop_codon:yes gene_type:complete